MLNTIFPASQQIKHNTKLIDSCKKVAKVRGLLSAAKVTQLSCGGVGKIGFGVTCAAAGMLVDSRQ